MLLTLVDAFKWVQIGACLAIGYYVVRWAGIGLLVIFGS
jgi:hypothetical protein